MSLVASRKKFSTHLFIVKLSLLPSAGVHELNLTGRETD